MIMDRKMAGLAIMANTVCGQPFRQVVVSTVHNRSKVIENKMGAPGEFHGKSTPTEHPYTFTLRE